MAHGGIDEIIRSGQFPGIMTRTARDDKAPKKPVGYDRATDTYWDRNSQCRLPMRGKAREAALKARGEVDLRDFKSAEEFRKYNDQQFRPTPIPEQKVAAAIQEAKHMSIDVNLANAAIEEVRAAKDADSVIKAVRKSRAAIRRR